MRTLIYVPIIHTDADMGSVGAAIEKQSAAYIGNERWLKHKEMVARFWGNVTAYFASFDAAGLKIFQDGLPAGGELGMKIVLQAADQGSPNYRIILDLLNRGAILCQTEDPVLLKTEYELLNSLVQSGSDPKRQVGRPQDKGRLERLTVERDKFVAGSIYSGLKEGETAVLFMGSYHDVLKRLPADIRVRQLKDRGKVNAYFAALLRKEDPLKLKELSDYMSRPLQPA